MRSLDDLHLLLVFFEARRGRLHGFRWRDSVDWKSCAPSQAPNPADQAIGVGDGASATFQLIKRYASGGAWVDRPIVKPVAGSVRIAVDAVEQAEGVGFTVDAATGVITLAAPPVPAPPAALPAPVWLAITSPPTAAVVFAPETASPVLFSAPYVSPPRPVEPP